jgi:hypothetical protein
MIVKRFKRFNDLIIAIDIKIVCFIIAIDFKIVCFIIAIDFKIVCLMHV